MSTRLRKRQLLNGKTFILLGLIGFSLVWLLPFATVALTALRSEGDMYANGVFSIPKVIRWENLTKAWGVGDFPTYFKNSLLLILLKVPLGILVAALAAYPLAKMSFRGNTALFIFFLVGLAVPIQVTLLPLVGMMSGSPSVPFKTSGLRKVPSLLPRSTWNSPAMSLSSRE